MISFRKKKSKKGKKINHLGRKIENIQANATTSVYVWMINRSDKGYTWRLKWIPVRVRNSTKRKNKTKRQWGNKQTKFAKKNPEMLKVREIPLRYLNF